MQTVLLAITLLASVFNVIFYVRFWWVERTWTSAILLLTTITLAIGAAAQMAKSEALPISTLFHLLIVGSACITSVVMAIAAVRHYWHILGDKPNGKRKK